MTHLHTGVRVARFAAACAFTTAMCGAHAAPLYIATPLGVPDVAKNFAYAINASGAVAGAFFAPDFSFRHARVEQGGVLHDLGTLGGSYGEAFAINTPGHVAGASQTAGSFDLRAFAWKGGALQDLGTLGGAWSIAYGINDSGHVVGVATLANGSTRAFRHANGTMTDLGTLGGPNSQASAINNAGQITGWSFVTAGTSYGHAFVHAAGVMQDLGTLGPAGLDGYGSAGVAINAAGDVTGYANPDRWGPNHAIVHSNGVMTDLFPGGPPSNGRAINAAREVTGTFDGPPPLYRTAFVHTGGMLHDLNALVLSGLQGTTLVEGVAINDSGQIVARGCWTQSDCMYFRLDRAGTQADHGVVAANPYGPLSVSGAAFDGTVLSNLTARVDIQLGSLPGSVGAAVEIDFQRIVVSPAQTIAIHGGAPGQVVVLRNLAAAPAVISGLLLVDEGAATAPALRLESAAGLEVKGSGGVMARGGAAMDTRGPLALSGGAIVNDGWINGAASLTLAGARITGGGRFYGDRVHLATFGNANNPVHGAHYLANAIAVASATGTDVALTLTGYGVVPQVFNVAVLGNATVAMPSAVAGSSYPPNNAPVPPGGSRLPGVPDPPFGGGSLIVQAAGFLKLDGGASGDFVFPGGIVLVADGVLDVGGVTIDNGWTTGGAVFQGVFLESPHITGSAGRIDVFTNDRNWVNMSSLPRVPVRAYQFVRNAFGGALFAPADAIAPHLNRYSELSEAAANGQCWTCLVNPAPVDMQ